MTNGADYLAIKSSEEREFEVKIDEMFGNRQNYTLVAASTINDILIYGDSEVWKYEPLEDITAFELSKILKVFINSIVGYSSSIAALSFIKENQLIRHFKKV